MHYFNLVREPLVKKAVTVNARFKALKDGRSQTKSLILNSFSIAVQDLDKRLVACRTSQPLNF